MTRRILVTLGTLLALAPAAAWAQGLPGGMTPAQAVQFYNSLPPAQQQAFLNAALGQANAALAGITPAQAKQIYQAMPPSQQASLKQQARDLEAQLAASNPGLLAQLKAMVKAWLGH